ncbi:MAG: hypothetical protein IJD43_10140 [Thermoguttaceae bacterium]|nr:hypothetical protein [Thermoguttaceae bacterium]
MPDDRNPFQSRKSHGARTGPARSGRKDQARRLRSDSIDAAPPIRFKTLISFSALTYAQALRLCLRYDDRFMKPKDADGFQRIFHEKLMG